MFLSEMIIGEAVEMVLVYDWYWYEEYQEKIVMVLTEMREEWMTMTKVED